MPDFKKLPTVNGTAVALADHTHDLAGVPPDQVTGLQLWLKADTLSLADNDPVASWTDSSGNGLHAVQATGGKQPTFKTGVVNGYPVVRFDGGDTLVCPSYGAALVMPYTVLAVCQTSLSTLAASAYIVGDQNGADAGVVMARSPNKVYGLYSGAALNTTIITDAWVVLTGQFNGASSELQVNTTPTAGNAGTLAATRVCIGSNRDAGQYLTGDIAEVVVYDPTPAAADLAQVRDGLLWKYGFSSITSFAWLTKWGTD